MSRFVGLREEQREAEVLMTRIIGFLPVGPRWCIREQARSHRKGVASDCSVASRTSVGASLLAKGPEQSA